MTRHKTQPTIGTLISGTHRVPDLIEAFYNELIQYPSTMQPRLSLSDHKLLQRVRYGGEYDDFTETELGTISYILEEMTDALEALAPEGIYFGSCEGDGADFGFWHVRADNGE